MERIVPGYDEELERRGGGDRRRRPPNQGQAGVIQILTFLLSLGAFTIGIGVNWQKLMQAEVAIERKLNKDVYDADQRRLNETIERLNRTLERIEERDSRRR